MKCLARFTATDLKRDRPCFLLSCLGYTFSSYQDKIAEGFGMVPIDYVVSPV